MTSGLYAYALTRAGVAAQVRGKGIGGAPVFVVGHDGLAALASPVDLDEFGEEGLRTHLEDLDWVREVAFAHDDVVREVARHGPVAPLRLATVFSEQGSIVDRLRHVGVQVKTVLDTVEGRGEWSVKAYSEQATDGEGGGTRPSSGRDYLSRRRREADRRETTSMEHADAVESLHEELAGIAVAGRQLAAQDRQLTGHTGEMLMNATYLVDDAEGGRFRSVVEDRRAPDGLRFAVDGPWPPYSFAVLEPT